jgi:hypothetical protein
MKTMPWFFGATFLFLLPSIGLAGQRYTETGTHMVYDVSQDTNGNIILQTINPNTESLWITKITPSNPKYQYFSDKFGLVDDSALSDSYTYDHSKAPFLPYYNPFYSPPYNEFSFFRGKEPVIPATSTHFQAIYGESTSNNTK